jgi:murein endopeptidase
MIHNYRHFEAVDPFDRIWQVEFRWQQVGISIRHADTIDVKWQLTSPEQTLEKAIALHHPALLALAKKLDRPLSDPWCMKVAAAHLLKMIETWQDMDKVLVTPAAEELEEAAQAVARWEGAKLEEARLT